MSGQPEPTSSGTSNGLSEAALAPISTSLAVTRRRFVDNLIPPAPSQGAKALFDPIRSPQYSSIEFSDPASSARTNKVHRRLTSAMNC
jgi:hypothetical protein